MFRRRVRNRKTTQKNIKKNVIPHRNLPKNRNRGYKCARQRYQYFRLAIPLEHYEHKYNPIYCVHALRDFLSQFDRIRTTFSKLREPLSLIAYNCCKTAPKITENRITAKPYASFITRRVTCSNLSRTDDMALLIYHVIRKTRNI